MRRLKSFTLHDVQNKILELLSHEVPRDIVNDVNKIPCLTAITVDETTDCANKEQVSICVSYVNDLQPVYDFIGMYETAHVHYWRSEQRNSGCFDSLVSAS